MMTLVSEYRYDSSAQTDAHGYLLPALLPLVEEALAGRPRRVFDLGCGSGATASALSDRSISVTGIDPSRSGIAQARRAYPAIHFDVGSAYDDLASAYGSFPVVVSLEVVEHVYDPRAFARTLFALVESKGTAIISTPYHGYLKNIAVAVTGRFDAHVSPLWDHGHIKFWSERTLRQLLEEAGFRDIRYQRVGRVRALAKSMIAIARHP